MINEPEISHVIQQAVAPVFLLTGIGSILGVMSNRLSRVVDRFRYLHEGKNPNDASVMEANTLARRVWWIQTSIILCTFSALCICLSVASLFVGAELQFDLSSSVAFLFVLAMLALILGLLGFLREIALSTGSIQTPQYKSRLDKS